MSGMEVLHETLLRWSLDEAHSAEVVEDAALAVADGVETPWVIAMACLPPEATADDLADVFAAAPCDLPFPLLPRGNPGAVLVATLVMVGRCSTGGLAERDLTRWAHTAIGHGRSEELERLVNLEDSYDLAEWHGGQIESVDLQVRTEVERLLTLHPPTADL